MARDREEFVLSFLKYAERLGHKYERYVEFDDLVQEAMLAVCRTVSEERMLDNPEAYVYTTMKNAAHALLRNRYLIKPEFAASHQRASDDEIVIKCYSLLEDFDIEEKEVTRCEDDWQWLYDLVSLLPESQSTVIGHFFGLVGYGKLSTHEMLRKFGYSSRGTISGAKDRALLNLRKHLDPSFQPRKRCNEQLRAARIEHGWTTKQVGSLLHMNTPRNYECWEREGMRPSGETIAKLCDLFGATPQELGFSVEGGA